MDSIKTLHSSRVFVTLYKQCHVFPSAHSVMFLTMSLNINTISKKKPQLYPLFHGLDKTRETLSIEDDNFSFFELFTGMNGLGIRCPVVQFVSFIIYFFYFHHTSVATHVGTYLRYNGLPYDFATLGLAAMDKPVTQKS